MTRSADDALNAPFAKTSARVRQKEKAKAKVQFCEAPGCTEKGEYPAPKSRRNTQDRYFFCVTHVREYNKAWNYFKGMTPGAVEAHRMKDLTWDRPTWQFGEQGRDKAAKRANTFAGNGLKDSFGFFDEDEAQEREAAKARDTRRLLRSLPPEYRDAFDTLQIQPPCTPEELKSHYKDLVRKLHPDLNQDNPDAEKEMKAVNAAYSLVRDIIENADTERF